MTPRQVFLAYSFNGWRVEFYGEHVEIVNPVSGDRHRLRFDEYSAVPVTIEVLSLGREVDARTNHRRASDRPGSLGYSHRRRS